MKQTRIEDPNPDPRLVVQRPFGLCMYLYYSIMTRSVGLLGHRILSNVRIITVIELYKIYHGKLGCDRVLGVLPARL